MNTLKKFKTYMGNRKVLLPLSLILSGLSGLVSLVPFVFIWLIVRSLLGTGDIAESTPVSTYAWWAFGTAVGGMFIYLTAIMLSHFAAFRVEVNMRREAMRKIANMPLGFFGRQMGGRMRKIIDEDASKTHSFLAHILPDLIGSILAPLTVIVLLFVFDWRLGIACMIPLIIVLGIMAYLMDPTRNDFQKRYLDAQERMSSEAVEYVRGIPVVKVFQQTVFSFKRFYDSIITYRDLVTKYTLSWQKPYSLYTVIINGFAYFLVPAAILLIGRSDSYATVITDMFFYILISPIIASNVMKIMYLNQNLFLANEALTRVEKLTDYPQLTMPEQTLSPDGYGVEFDNVVFRYDGATQNAVDGVSFAIPQGQTFALVGASGSGKTTIARLVPRFWDVTEGSVRIGGVDVKHIAKEELMNNISFVFQNTKLFKTSLYDNITYGCRNTSPEAIDRAIDLSQSREIIDRLPDGLDTKIGTEDTYLSGGEQQRIALARAILKNAPVVVLDEATAFADPENEHLIQKALHLLMKGKTALMIAHRLSSVRNVDRILVIDNGKIAEQGTHDQLIALGGIYKEMWNEYQKAVAWTV